MSKNKNNCMKGMSMSKIRKQYKSLMKRADQSLSFPEVKALEHDLFEFRLMIEGLHAELKTMIHNIEEKEEWLDWGPDAWEVTDECLESLLDCLS